MRVPHPTGRWFQTNLLFEIVPIRLDSIGGEVFGVPFVDFLPTERESFSQLPRSTPTTDEHEEQEHDHDAECEGYQRTLGEACHKEGEE